MAIWPFDVFLDALSSIVEFVFEALGRAMASILNAVCQALGIERIQPPGGGGGGEEPEDPDRVGWDNIYQALAGGGQVEDLTAIEGWNQKLAQLTTWWETNWSRTNTLFPPKVYDVVHKTASETPGVYYLTYAVMFLAACLQGIKQVVGITSDLFRMETNAALKHQIPDLQTLTQIGIRHPTGQTLLKQLANRLGYAEEVYDLVEELGRTLLSPGEIQSLYLRGEFGTVAPWAPAEAEQEVRHRLNQLGYTGTDIDHIQTLFWWLPPPGDIIRFAVREIFDPAYRATYYDPYPPPEEFVTQAAKVGVSQEVAGWYWNAHWMLPSVEQGFRMFWRIPEFGEQELDHLLRAQDVMPYYRDHLKQIAYHPLTRVDVRRMHALGTIGDADLFRAYSDLGYSPENAMKMVEFTLDYNTKSEKTEARKELLKSFDLGLLDEGGLAQGLAQLGFREQHIQLLIQGAVLERTRDAFEIDVKVVQYDYRDDQVTAAEAENRLLALGMQPEAAARYVRLWTAQKREVEAKPSIMDLREFLAQGRLTADAFRERMQLRGFSDADIDLYLMVEGQLEG